MVSSLAVQVGPTGESRSSGFGAGVAVGVAGGGTLTMAVADGDGIGALDGDGVGVVVTPEQPTNATRTPTHQNRLPTALPFSSGISRSRLFSGNARTSAPQGALLAALSTAPPTRADCQAEHPFAFFPCPCYIPVAQAGWRKFQTNA
jgi:hypothetical protein